MKKLKQVLLALMLCLTLAVPSQVPFVGSAETVMAAAKLSQTKMTMVTGQKKQLKLTGASGNVTWGSADRSIAAVDKKGIVTAKNKGSVTVYAQEGSQKYFCKITVQKPVLSKTSCTVSAGKSCSLKVRGTNQKIVWKSSNPKIATVSSKGTVKGLRSGKCKIYACINGVNYGCTVTVKAASSSSKPQQAQVSYVYLSATGSKYHRIPNCGRMNPSRARKVSLSYAQARYGRCSNCW